MARAQLDESRTFGIVYGPGMCRYTQDHKEFGGNKVELGDGTPEVVDEGDPDAENVEDRPIASVTRADLVERIEVLGGTVKQGATKTTIRQNILDAVAAKE